MQFGSKMFLWESSESSPIEMIRLSSFFLSIKLFVYVSGSSESLTAHSKMFRG